MVRIAVMEAEKDFAARTIQDGNCNGISHLKTLLQLEVDAFLESNTEMLKNSHRQEFQRLWKSYSVSQCVKNPLLLK